MADATKQLQIVISARDEASHTIRNMGSGFSDLASKATVGSAAILGSFALISKSVIQTGADMQSARTSFETFLGSGEKAGALLKQLSDFAVKTPFDLPQVVDGTKRLLAFGVAADDVIPTFRNLGDLSQGNKVKLDQLILAFGQMKAATRLTGNELRQFTEAGIPLLDALAAELNKNGGAMVQVSTQSKKVTKELESQGKAATKAQESMVGLNRDLAIAQQRLNEANASGKAKTSTLMSLQNRVADVNEKIAKANSTIGSYSTAASKAGGTTKVFGQRAKVTAAQVKKMIEGGEISFETAQKALMAMNSEGGRFFKNMESQSKTFTGVMSNIRDEFARFALNILGFSEEGEIRKGSIFYYLQIGAEKVLQTLQIVRPIAQKFVDIIISNGPAVAAIVGALLGLMVPLAIAFIGLVAPALAFAAAGAAIAALGILIVQNWGKIQPILQPVIDIFTVLFHHFQQVANEVAEDLMPALKEMGAAFNEFWVTIQPLMPALKILGAVIAVLTLGPLAGLLGILTGIIQALTMMLPYVIQFYTGIVQVVTAFFQLLVGIFTLNGELIMQSMRTMWDGIRNIFIGSIMTVIAAVAGFIDGVITFFRTLYEVLVGGSIVPDMVLAIIMWIGKLPAAITAILTTLQKAFTEKFDAIWSSVKTWRDNVVGAFNAVADSVNNAINALKNAAKAGVKGITGLSFQHGGFVPGSYDEPVPAILHGGERVVPRNGVDVAGQNGGGMGGITINFTGPVDMDSPTRVQELADKIIAILGRQNELAARGVGY